MSFIVSYKKLIRNICFSAFPVKRYLSFNKDPYSISGWRKRFAWKGWDSLRSLSVGAGWIHSFNSHSKQSLSTARRCVFLEPEEYWEDPVGIWAKFQCLMPPQVWPAWLLPWWWLGQAESRWGACSGWTTSWRHGLCLAWCEARVLRGQADRRVNIPPRCPSLLSPGACP